jgi:hypothetical protein
MPSSNELLAEILRELRRLNIGVRMMQEDIEAIRHRNKAEAASVRTRPTLSPSRDW